MDVLQNVFADQSPSWPEEFVYLKNPQTDYSVHLT